MSEGQAGTETRRTLRWSPTLRAYVLPHTNEPPQSEWVVEVVEASDPEGTAREGLITTLRTELARQGEVAGQQQAAGYEKGWAEGRAYEAQMQSNSRASGGTRPAFTDEDDLPDDVRRNSYTAGREPGLHVKGLTTVPDALATVNEIAAFVVPEKDSDCRLDLEDAIERCRAVLSAVAGEGT